MKQTATPQPVTEPVKLPFFTTIFGAYGILAENFKAFLVLGSVFALLLSVIYIGSGLGLLCINHIYQENFFCTTDVRILLIVRLFVFFISCLFIRGWYQVITGKRPNNRLAYFVPQKTDLKIAGIFLGYVLCLLVATGSAYLLYMRVPNPDWRIELAYFAVVSLGFLVPFLTLRFMCYIAFAAGGESLPGLRIVWEKTSGNFFLLLSGIIVLFILSLFIAISLLHQLVIVENAGRFYVAVFSEYISQLLYLLIVACFTNYCYLQKKLLFERNNDGKSGN